MPKFVSDVSFYRIEAIEVEAADETEAYGMIEAKAQKTLSENDTVLHSMEIDEVYEIDEGTDGEVETIDEDGVDGFIPDNSDPQPETNYCC